MPFPFTLPTTSPVSFSSHYTSPVYPSAPLILTQLRGSLRNRLKSHKRLSASSRNTDLPEVLKLIEEYIPYLLFAEQSIHSGDVLPSDVASKPLQASWRSTLTVSKMPGQEPKRVERGGLGYEISFALSTLAYVHTLLARKEFSEAMVPKLGDGQKQALLNSAIKHLLVSRGVFTYSASLSRAPTELPWPIDLNPTVLSAMAALSLADASLLAVSKQDPYPTFLAVSSLRTKDTEYLYAPPDPPNPAKALLFARICIVAASHAERALGLLAGVREDLAPELLKYLENLQKVGRAKACRFLGIEAEGSGTIGVGIGWLILAREILGKPNKERDASADAGRTEESRVLEELEKIWKKSNDSVYFQLIESSGVLAAKIPTGREVHSIVSWKPEKLAADVVRNLRGRVAEEDVGDLDEEDSEDEAKTKLPGGFGSGGYY